MVDDVHIIEMRVRATQRRIEKRQLLKILLIADERPKHATEDVIDRWGGSGRIEQLFADKKETPQMLTGGTGLQIETVEIPHRENVALA
jgi:hypothetical protein